MNNTEDPSPIFQKIKSFFASNKAEEIQSLVEEAGEEDADSPLTEHERRLITAALKFDDVVAEDVAAKRLDIISVPQAATFEEVWEKFTASRHSRLPVVGKDLDDIKGFITLKDMLPFTQNHAQFNLKKLMRPITFIPESMEMPEVLQHMRKAHASIAVVVDEYGGTGGLITLKDVLEKLVGELEDEDEAEEGEMITQIGPNHYRVNPLLRLDDLRTHLGGPKAPAFLQFQEEPEFDTIGGLTLHLAGHVPETGDKIKLPTKGGYISIIKSTRRKLESLELKF